MWYFFYNCGRRIDDYATHEQLESCVNIVLTSLFDPLGSLCICCCLSVGALIEIVTIFKKKLGPICHTHTHTHTHRGGIHWIGFVGPYLTVFVFVCGKMFHFEHLDRNWNKMKLFSCCWCSVEFHETNHQFVCFCFSLMMKWHL